MTSQADEVNSSVLQSISYQLAHRGLRFRDRFVGLRARYEIRREFAPYAGISFRQD